MWTIFRVLALELLWVKLQVPSTFEFQVKFWCVGTKWFIWKIWIWFFPKRNWQLHKRNLIHVSKLPLFSMGPQKTISLTPCWVDVWMHRLPTYIVSCHGVVQLRGLVLGCPKEVPLRLWLVSLFYSMKVPLKLKKNPTGKQQSSLKVFHITSKYGRPNWHNI